MIVYFVVHKDPTIVKVLTSNVWNLPCTILYILEYGTMVRALDDQTMLVLDDCSTCYSILHV